jgi:2-polyprenyl-3-methyl-5-hydroxy-6-metoxy-1,4-benzoquinol methylase
VTEHDRPDTPVRAAFSREDWNRRYAKEELLWTAEPNSRFVAEVGALKPGRALDLGCGEGRNAVWLAEQGWAVTGVDFSEVALAKAERLAGHRSVSVEWVQADLRDYRPRFEAFDLVVLLYLQLPVAERRLVLGRASTAVAPGGTLFVLGHDTRNLAEGYGGPRDPAVLFTPDDIAADLAGLVVEQAATVARRVPLEEGAAVAIDALVRARRVIR